jgi:hypothetical protein
MHPDLHRYLDGELPREALPPELAADAAAWDDLVEEARLRTGETVAPPWLEARVMNALPDAPAGPLWERALDWLLRPRQVTVRPIGLIGAAAALALLLVVPGPWREPAAPWTASGEFAAHAGAADRAAAGEDGAVVYVQFVFASQHARSVSVAGDFNGWQPSSNILRDGDGDGIWTGHVAVRPGVYKYMFVVDGQEWVTDPRAERHMDDGFGMRNALIAVSLPEAESAS